MAEDRPETVRAELSPAALRNMMRAAHLCLIGTLLTFTLLYWFKGDLYLGAFSLVAVHFVGGRAGTAAAGLEMGFSVWFLLFHISIQDLIVMLYCYPLFVRGFHSAAKIPFVGDMLARTHAFSLQHRDRIAPYGVAGLMVFVFFPFWSTGPLVGVVVGYLIGLRAWVTFTTVILGNVLAVSAWLAAYRWLRLTSPNLALTVLGIILAATLGGALYARLGQSRKRDDSEAPPAEDAPSVWEGAEGAFPKPIVKDGFIVAPDPDAEEDEEGKVREVIEEEDSPRADFPEG